MATAAPNRCFTVANDSTARSSMQILSFGIPDLFVVDVRRMPLADQLGVGLFPPGGEHGRIEIVVHGSRVAKRSQVSREASPARHRVP
jgi:hypothetical protein